MTLTKGNYIRDYIYGCGGGSETVTYSAGYYWVKYQGAWVPAEYSSNGYWMLIGCEGPAREEELDEVGASMERPED